MDPSTLTRLVVLVVKQCWETALQIQLDYMTALILKMLELAVKVHLLRCAATSALSCTYFSVCTYGDIRLVDGSTQFEGRVEICVHNAWGTICDDFWDNTDARVVCRQAGFSDQNAIARSFAFFGQGTDPIVLDDVRCTGTERRLIDCPYTATHNCNHFEDAGVTCQPCRFWFID